FVVGDKSLTLKRCPPNTLPFANVNGLNLFRSLSVGCLLALFQALLLEQKLVFVSSHSMLLLEAAETIATLIFPFQYQGVYMPILPLQLIDFLSSPVPFMAGVQPHWLSGVTLEDVVLERVIAALPWMSSSPERSNKSKTRPLKRIKIGKLGSLTSDDKDKDDDDDNNNNNNYSTGIMSSSSSSSSSLSSSSGLVSLNINSKDKDKDKDMDNSNYNLNGKFDAVSKKIDTSIVELLPISQFLTSGTTVENDHKSSVDGVETLEEELFRQLQHGYLKFFTSILQDYNKYFEENTKTQMFEFNRKHFLDETTDKSSRPFMECLTNTQMFHSFVQERCEYLEDQTKRGINANEKPSNIKYFDEELIAKKNRGAFAHKHPTPFLDDRSMDIVGVFVANPPNRNNLDNMQYSYQSFPNLKMERYGKISKV
ncbi:hypothetical protein RFI_07934, partial [Reticulomyxa filosa]